MDKALKMGQTSAIGGLHLFIGKLLYTIILAVGTIVLALFILETDYGLYTIALIPSTTVLLFQDWGVSSAMIRYIAKDRATNEGKDLRKIIVAGLTFTIATGMVLAVVTLLIANIIATSFFANSEAALLIGIASITVLALPMLSAAQSIFTGFEKMKLNACTIICLALTQATIPTLLVYFGYGALGAIIGYSVSTLVASIIAMCLLYLRLFRKLAKDPSKTPIQKTLKPLIKYGYPLAIGGILSGLSTQIFMFLMATYCDTALIGNFRVAYNFSALLTVIVFPISTVLFPAFSKINPKKEHNLMQSLFESSIKYSALLLVPATLGMFVLSAPLIATIYGDKWAYAPSFLAPAVLGNLMVVLGSLSVLALFSALGETKLVMKMNFLNLLVGIPLAFVLVPTLGIFGVIFGLILSGLPSILVGVYLAKKRYNLRIGLRTSAKVMFAASVAAVGTFVFLRFIVADSIVLLATGGAMFVALYVTTAPFVGAINRVDITNFRIMFSGLGVISKVLDVPLRIMDIMVGVRLLYFKRHTEVLTT